MSKEISLENDNIKGNSENTTSIANISYKIEDAKYANMNDFVINDQIKYLKKEDKFPKNLEYQESFQDKKQGVGAVVFKDTNTGKSIIGIPGTNMNKENDHGNDRIKDIKADYNIDAKSELPEGEYYREVNKFVKKATEKYDVETITGHSLGGRGAMMLGANNNIPNIVTYNSAPIYTSSTRPATMAMTDTKNMINSTVKYNDYSNLANKNSFSSPFLYPFQKDIKGDTEKIKKDIDNDRKIQNLFKNYNGNITRFSTNADPLTISMKGLDAYYPGKEVKLGDVKGHSMNNFMSDREQNTIKAITYNIEEVEKTNSKNYQQALKSTKSSLRNIDNLEANLIQNTGSLTSSSEKVLRNMVAISLTTGLQSSVVSEINELKAMYDEYKISFSELWNDAENEAMEEGKKLSESEQMTALNEGGASEEKIVKKPNKHIDTKLKQLEKINDEFDDYIDKLKKSIKKMMEKDQELANQIGVNL